MNHENFNKNQHKSVTGTVIFTGEGLPLPGVSVKLKGTSKIVQTDFDGVFSIKAQTGDTLIFSYLGMLTKKVTISNQKTISISLEEDELVCVETVVGGQPTITKYDKCISKKRRKERKLKRQQIRNDKNERTNVGKFLYGITNIFRNTK
ncbi:carboxypeptidase-like regulatory domain-containing protein [Psychroserpens sp.]